MKELVRQAMKEGAMGVASSLIYPPGFFAKKEELIELSKAAGEFGGLYASHIRNEGNQVVEAIQACRAELASGGGGTQSRVPTGPKTLFVVEQNVKLQDAFREKFREQGSEIYLKTE